MSFRLTRETMLDDLSAVVSYHDIEKEIRAHLHEYYEVELVIEGSGKQYLNGKSLPLSRGDFYIVTPLDVHSVTPDKRLKIINLSFDEKCLSDAMLSRLLNSESVFPKLSEEETQKITFLMDLIKEERDKRDEFTAESVTRLTRQCVAELLRRVKVVKAIKKKAIYNACVEYISKNYARRITVRELSETIGYSENHLSRVFSESCGVPFTKYLRNYRVNRAKSMLTATELSVMEVGLYCGFSTASNFFNAFKSEVGVSPYKYRRNTRAQL